MTNIFPKYKFKHALYDVIIASGVLCNLITFIAEVVINGFYPLSVLYLVVAVAFLILGLFGTLTDKTNEATIVLFMILDFVEMPLVFYIYSINAIAYLLLTIVLNALFLKGLVRKLLLPATFLGYLIVAIINKFRPQHILKISEGYIPAVISMFVVSIILVIISLMMVHQYDLESRNNKELSSKLDTYSKRDVLTNVFTKQYAYEHLSYMLESTNAFTISVYKILSYEKLEAKYGKQFCDVATVALADILVNNASECALISRYSPQTFMVIYNSYDTEEVKESISKINDEIKNGIVKSLDVMSYNDKGLKDENAKSVINRISIRLNGFGE